MTRLSPEHIDGTCAHCHATLCPRVEVFANADADEWVCSAGCHGLYFDWSPAYLAELGLTDTLDNDKDFA